MSTPVDEIPKLNFDSNNARSSDEENVYGGEGPSEHDQATLHLHTSNDTAQDDSIHRPSPSQTRAQEYQLDDEMALLHAERVVSRAREQEAAANLNPMTTASRSKSRRTNDPDEFDINTNPIHEKNALYRPPEHPTTKIAAVFKRIHESSFLVRYFTYITPVVVILLIPLLLGALLFNSATVGGVYLMWFSVWLETVWLTLWLGRIVAKMIPGPLGVISSLFTNNSKKWRDMGKQLEIPATLFFWWLGVEVSFLPIMNSHTEPGYTGDQTWKGTVNKIIITFFVGTTLNFFEKIIIQLIAISFHLRTYADRIDLNKFQINSLVKLYQYSKEKISMEDSDFEEGDKSGPASGTRTPALYLEKATKGVGRAFNKVGDVAGKVAGDFTGKQITKSTHPHSVVLMLLNSTQGSQVLARRLFRTFVREGTETIFSDDMKNAFDNDEEAAAAFAMFDKDMNGDISMEELESVCVEIGRERKSITASLKDLDSVVSKLDAILLFIVVCVTILVLITLISTSAAGVLTSAGSTVLALSWLFSATAQEFLQSVVFVFVKHPFDVGDRVTIYGNTGSNMKGDDYFVKEISLLYTEFKKMEGHLVQAPNSYLNTLFILNMRRSGGLAEGVPLTVKFGTTLDQIDELRNRLLDFVKVEKREYQSNILTEIREVVEAHSVNLNVVFFYKSNWQNEGLRLQRRNKFICALMISMQEIGIEGPRMRIPGQKEESPFYVQYPVARQTDGMSSIFESPGPRSGSLARDTPTAPNAAAPSRLQSGSIVSRRGRGESVSAMSRRVDFSLGMKDVSSADMAGDVYDDSPKWRGSDVTRSYVARTASLRPRAVAEEGRNSDTTVGRSTSRDDNVRSRFGLNRSNTGSGSQLSAVKSIHQNRFFGRRGRGESRSDDGVRQDLMEQGMADIPERAEHGPSAFGHMDPRTGMVSPQAFKLDSRTSDGGGPERMSTWGSQSTARPPPLHRTEDFEMRRLA